MLSLSALVAQLIGLIARENFAPVARAGGDRSVVQNAALTLDSAGSTDADGTIESVRWLSGATVLGTNSTLVVDTSVVGSRTIRLEVTDDDGATSAVDTRITVTEPVVVPPSAAGYITDRALAPEDSYVDYSGGISDPVTRRRILRFGADMAELNAAIDYTHVVEPEPTVTAINAAIDQVSARPGGGVVRPTATASMPIRDVGVTLKDNVVYDGDRIATHDVRGDFAEATQAFSAENFAILNVNTNADGESCYAVRMDDCRNAVVQGIDATRHGSDSIRLQKHNRDITVRYNRISSERDEDGGTTHRNQHGIVSASIGDGVSEHPAASSRFGIVYSTGIAIYSNEIEHTDGHAIDSHASNVEVMGNYMNDCAFGCKFPHADNVLVHHNRFGGARAISGNDDPWAIRLFSNNEYLELSGGRTGHVGYAGDRVFVAQNKFEDTATRTDIRVEHMHGESWFLGNEFQPNGTKYQFGTLGDADSRYFHSGQDSTVTAARSSAYDARWIEETDADTIALDPATIVALMRRPRTQADWHSYSHAPLPEVNAFGNVIVRPDSLDAPVLEFADPIDGDTIRVAHSAVSGATDYVVQSRVGTGPWGIAVIADALSHDIDGLSDGTPYEFRVLARDTTVDPGVQSGFSNTLVAAIEGNAGKDADYIIALEPIAGNNILDSAEAQNPVIVAITTDAPNGTQVDFTVSGDITAAITGTVQTGAASAEIPASTISQLVDGDAFTVTAAVPSATASTDVSVAFAQACSTVFDRARSEASFTFNDGVTMAIPAGSTVDVTLEWVSCGGSRAPNSAGGGRGLSVDVGSEVFSSESGLVNTYRYTAPAESGSHTAVFQWGNSRDPSLCSVSIEFTTIADTTRPPPDPPPPSGPGAVEFIGHGSGSRFGRDGRTITVTNLNYSGSGSFRDAVLQSGDRTVVFGPGTEGIVPVPSEINIGNGRLTVAGHTAPGTGFGLQATPGNAGMVLKTTASDIAVENIGIYQNNGPDPDNRDAANVSTNSFDIMFSQCSIMWGSDETASVWHRDPGRVGAVTFQYCLIAEGLSNVGHEKGEHSKGVLFGKALDECTIHHCWFTGSSRRNPRVQSDRAQIINNIIIANNDTLFRGMAIAQTNAAQTMRYDIMYNRVYGSDGPENGCLLYPEKSFKAGKPSIHAVGNIHDGSRSNNAMPNRAFFGGYGGGAMDNFVERPTPHLASSLDIVTHENVENDDLREFVRGLVGRHSWNRHPNEERVLNIQPDTVAATNSAVQLY